MAAYEMLTMLILASLPVGVRAIVCWECEKVELTRRVAVAQGIQSICNNQYNLITSWNQFHLDSRLA